MCAGVYRASTSSCICIGWLWLKEKNDSSPHWCCVEAKCFPCKGKGLGHNHFSAADVTALELKCWLRPAAVL